ncbi:hypothetical protein PoB_003277800 [Plakobranchus ocellatus]|uniref:Uncharacterized protein n=1 Tax=Plakobranchus ocellatus TaxID=259542 RepID=A0AAV4AHK6_9GAST|nr:hypothetical protein PoB_003277800 [Plakobranchus ocellatus]
MGRPTKRLEEIESEKSWGLAEKGKFNVQTVNTTTVEQVSILGSKPGRMYLYISGRDRKLLCQLRSTLPTAAMLTTLRRSHNQHLSNATSTLIFDPDICTGTKSRRAQQRLGVGGTS